MLVEEKAKVGDKDKCKFRGCSNSLSTPLSTLQDPILHLHNQKQLLCIAFSLWWAHSFSPNTWVPLILSLESYQSVSHSPWCLTSNSSSHFPKAIAAFTALTANEFLHPARSPTAPSTSQPSSIHGALPLTGNTFQELSLPVLLCS